MINHAGSRAKVILVPVKVIYDEPTNTMYSYQIPTQDKVEKAFQESLSDKDLIQIKEYINATYCCIKEEAKKDNRPHWLNEAYHYLRDVGKLLKMW